MKIRTINCCDGCQIMYVYGYNMNTVKEMEAQGWTLTGTYIGFLTFRKDAE